MTLFHFLFIGKNTFWISVAALSLGLLFLSAVPQLYAATVSVNCTGTSGSPTAVSEADLNADDVTFSDTGGDGYCVLDEPITAASVVLEAGVTMTHVTEDADGVNISTTGDFTIQSGAYIDVSSRGCTAPDIDSDTAGFTPNDSNVCVTGTATYSYANGSGGGGYGGVGGGGKGVTTTSNSGGNTHGSATVPVLLGSSAGRSTYTAGGSGGGLIRLDVGGIFSHNGSLLANGGNGNTFSNNIATGGGSGGAIYVTATTFTGSTGTFSAIGGNGGNNSTADAGGGGGGRIAVVVTTNSFTGLGNEDFSVSGGTAETPAVNGSKGTVFIHETSSDVVTVYHGFDYNGDYSVASWTSDSSATNQYCGGTDATPSVTTTGIISLAGTFVCTHTSVTGLTFTPGDDVTFNGLTFTMSEKDFFTITGSVDVAVTGNSVITSNVKWENLTTFTLDNGSSISANAKGCTAPGGTNTNGYGDNGSNVCLISTGGYGLSPGGGGGGYGGAGGNGVGVTASNGGTTSGSATTPNTFGASSGASTFAAGGAGGGLIRIGTTGTMTINGSLMANGGTGKGFSGNIATGGGSGGSIYLTTEGVYAGSTGAFSASGGNGFNNSTADGGGGGGGRIRVNYGVDSSSYLAGLTAGVVAAGGTGPDTAGEGSEGSLSKNDGYGPSMSISGTDDDDADGQIDTLVVNFTEALDAGTVSSADFSISDGYAIDSVVVSDSAEVTITLVESGTVDTNATPTVTIVGSIDDSAGNSTTSGSRVMVDGSSPAIISISPSDGALGQDSDVRIIVTYSEPISTGTLAYTLSEIPADLVVTWSAGNTVLTLSTSDGYSAGDTITFEITASDDVNSQVISPTPSLVGGDLIFTFDILAGGGAPASGTVAILSPNGGEIITAGSSTTIDWTWTLGTNDARTQLYFSIDGGRSYTLIKDYYNGSVSEYTWIVPVVESTNALVKVTRSENSYVVSDSSNQVFTIQAASTSEGGSTSTDPSTNPEEVVITQPTTGENGLILLPETNRSPFTGEEETVTQGLVIGDVIVGQSYDTVYYLDSDLTRRPFMNAQIFFTWFDSFDEIKTVSDATLSVFALGEPMLPKSGVVLVKIQSDPKVYTVETFEGDISRILLRWIPSEETAISLYGSDWADYVIDLPPTIFTRFETGDQMSDTEELPEVEMKRRIELVV